jgi:hypothetical protein
MHKVHNLGWRRQRLIVIGWKKRSALGTWGGPIASSLVLLFQRSNNTVAKVVASSSAENLAM